MCIDTGTLEPGLYVFGFLTAKFCLPTSSLIPFKTRASDWRWKASDWLARHDTLRPEELWFAMISVVLRSLCSLIPLDRYLKTKTT